MTNFQSSGLERRWDLWRKGSIDKLIQEGEVIQKHISMSSRRPKYNSAANFSSLMRQGKVKQAIRIITDSNQKGPLDLDAIDPLGDSIRRILLDKHPVSQALNTDCICEPSADLSNNFHPILFEAITYDTIKSAAINTHGAAGPSGVDAWSWRRFCSAFRNSSQNLCLAMAAFCRRLAVDYITRIPSHRLQHAV